MVQHQMPAKAVLVASHPRSGTHLVLDTIRRQFLSTAGWRLPGLPLDHLYLNLERLGADTRRFSPKLARRILGRASTPLLKTHFLADFSESWSAAESVKPPEEFLNIVDTARVVYVVRHPMAVMSSYFQFLSSLHAEVRRMSLDDFLVSQHWSGTVDRLGWWCSHVEGWQAQKNTLIVRYEDLISAPYETVDRIAAHIGETPRLREPILPEKVTSVLQTRIHRLTRLSPPSTAIIADRLRYPLVDWRKALSQHTRDMVRVRCHALLDEFDYELRDVEATADG